MMTLFSQLFAIAAFILFLGLILFVIFGQVTVRKLRKNPKTKDALGFEYMSGSSIANVAKALAISRKKAQEMKENKMSFLYADIELLYEHTNKVDRILAKTLYWLMGIGGVLLVLLMLLNIVGVFE